MKKYLNGDLFFSLLGYCFGCFILLCFCGGVIGSWAGCIPSFKEPSHILKRTDQYYNLIKAIVTDEEVYALIPPETLNRLHEVDDVYQSLRKLANSIDESQATIMAMAQCGLDVCDILSELDIDGDNKEEIAAVRLSIKAFMATMLDSAPIWVDLLKRDTQLKDSNWAYPHVGLTDNNKYAIVGNHLLSQEEELNFVTLLNNNDNTWSDDLQ